MVFFISSKFSDLLNKSILGRELLILYDRHTQPMKVIKLVFDKYGLHVPLTSASFPLRISCKPGVVKLSDTPQRLLLKCPCTSGNSLLEVSLQFPDVIWYSA